MNSILKNILILFFIAIAGSWNAIAEEEVVINLSKTWQNRYLGDMVYYLKEGLPPKLAMSEETTSRYKRGESRIQPIGRTPDGFWGYINFYNPSDQPQKLWLNIFGTFRNQAKAYKNGKLISYIPPNATFRDRFLQLTIAPGEKARVYINVISIIPSSIYWTIFTSQLQVQQSISEYEFTILAIFLVGGMTVLFNGLLLWAYRKKTYLYYILYLTSFMLFTITACNLTSNIWLSAFSAYSLIYSSLFAIAFTIEFLKLEGLPSRIMECGAGLIILSFFISQINESVGLFLLNSVNSLLSPIFIGIGILQIIKKRPNGVLYTIAFGTLLLGLTLSSLRFAGIATSDSISPWIFWYCVGIENILLLLAIGKQIYITEHKRVTNHLKLSDNYLALKHNFDQLSKVFYPHQVTKMKQGIQLEHTMPIGSHYACVLSLDVINSSKYMNQEGLRDFLRIFFSECGALMFEGYHQETLSSRAYRVKEMGDGLLCAVGFPFSPPSDRSVFETAVRLAEDLHLAFHNCQKTFAFPEKIRCSIGIAYDLVEGYFSKTMPIEYDLWGRGVVLSTRYEQTRKVIKEYPRGDLIIVQDKVFKQLGQSSQRAFSSISLTDVNLEIRDDPDAEVIYFKSPRFGREMKPSA